MLFTSELMYELKRLQHGERPVTGSESRDRVGNFFHRRLQRSDTSSGVANIDDVEQHRPEQVRPTTATRVSTGATSGSTQATGRSTGATSGSTQATRGNT